MFLPTCISQNNEIIHPVPEKLPSAGDINFNIDMTKHSDSHLQSLLFLEQAEPGELKNKNKMADENPFHYLDIRKADIDSKRNIYLLHNRTNSIIVNDEYGNYQYTIGRGGKGPGEFLELVTFAFNSDYSTLYALDLFEIEVFDLKEGQFEYVKTIAHDFIKTYDMCMLNNELFISGYKFSPKDTSTYENATQRFVRAMVTPPISRMNTDTYTTEASFGYVYASEFGYGTYDGFLSRMWISCNEKTETVIGYQQDFPFIFGYDREGKTKWISKTEGIKAAQHTEFKSAKYKNAGLIQYTQEGKFFYKLPPPLLDLEEYQILQMMQTGPVMTLSNYNPELLGKEELMLRTILVNSESGEVTHSDNYPLINLIKDGVYIWSERNPDTFEYSFSVNSF